MFAMRYCKECLERFRPLAEENKPGQYLLLNIPVEDGYGLIFNAFMAITRHDFLTLLNSTMDIIDFAKHAELIRIEEANIRPSHPVIH